MWITIVISADIIAHDNFSIEVCMWELRACKVMHMWELWAHKVVQLITLQNNKNWDPHFGKFEKKFILMQSMSPIIEYIIGGKVMNSF